MYFVASKTHMYRNTSKFEKLKALVGKALLEAMLKKAAFDALNSGDWYKVLSIAEFVVKDMRSESAESINGYETREEIRYRSRKDREIESRSND